MRRNQPPPSVNSAFSACKSDGARKVLTRRSQRTRRNSGSPGRRFFGLKENHAGVAVEAPIEGFQAGQGAEVFVFRRLRDQQRILRKPASVQQARERGGDQILPVRRV